MLSRPPRRRAGMTMIELLVVIAIIALLAALLVGALMRARVKGQEVQVVADLNMLQTAVGQFKAAYNQTPIPCAGGEQKGLFRLCTDYPAATDTWPEKRFLKRMFQRMSESDNGLKDKNGNAISHNSPVLLDGNQCLVFFLTGGSFTDYTGFSTNPQTPFDKASASRKNAFFDLPQSKRMSPRDWFTKNRTEYTWLASVPATPTARWSSGPTETGFDEPWMIDPWGNPYLYFTSDAGNDYPFQEGYTHSDSTTQTRLREPLQVGPWGGPYSPFEDGASTGTGTLPSGAPKLYPEVLAGTRGPSPFLESYTATPSVSRKFYNRTSFQIISAGPDGQIGPGGAKRQSDSSYETFKPSGKFYTQADAGGDDFANFRPLKLSAE